METPMLKVNVRKEDVLKGKFTKTISAIEGCLKEAKGDMEVSQNYSASAVHGRMARIKEAFEADIDRLSNDIEVVYEGQL